MATTENPQQTPVVSLPQEIEKIPNVAELQDHGVYGFTTSVDELPKGYYRSAGFIGTFFAVAMSQSAAAGGFSLIGPILSQIDEDLGPDPNILWLALVYTLCLGIGLLLVGRITDICGRRWFFLGASFLALIGSIVSATAKTIPVLIGGQTLISLGACGGLSFGTSLGELVPIKYRFMVVGAMFIGGMPTVGLGAGIATAFVLYTGPQWRWCYWLLTIMNGIGTALWFFFYHPPTFLMKQGNRRRMTVIKNFDYVGALLFVAGLLLFLMGLSWGGSAYPWKSAHVISTIVIGFLCLVALFVYEIYAPARLLQEPLIPRHLLQNRDFMFTIVLLGFGASVYYAFALVWPQMVATVYNNHGLMTNGWVSCIVGIGLAAGQLSGGFLAEKIGHVKYQCNFAMAIAGITLASAAVCTPDNRSTLIALTFLSSFAVGWNESVAFALATICIKDQQEIGTAAGVAGSSRSTISTVASTIYQVVLAARSKKTIAGHVPSTLIKAGLPSSSVVSFMTAFSVGTPEAFAAVKGLTPTILEIGRRAYQVAYSDAYRTVFLTSIAFSVCGFGFSLLVPNVDNLMTNDVATALQARGGGEQVPTFRNKEVDL